MKITTLGEVIDLTRLMHQRLGECLGQSASETGQTSEKWLLAYLAEHETALASMVSAFESSADANALQTWVYDYLSRAPIDPGRVCDPSYAELDSEEIGRAILDFHNQVMALYGDLLSRAKIPKTRELLRSLLDMERHETLRLAQQMNFGRDL